MAIQVKILDPRAKIPSQAKEDDAGFDIIACIDQPLVLKYGEAAVLVPTGLALYIGSESKKLAGILLPRSGLGHKEGLVLGNTVGLIDAGFQNQWMVSAYNRGNKRDAQGNFADITINPGDRLAQVIFVEVFHPDFVEVEEFDTETERGQGGFGSSGVAS